MQIANWSHAGLKFQGLSLSGVRTSIAMPEISICFDVAQGLPFAIPMKNFLITHGHLDHAAGIPYIISQKGMLSHPPAHFYMPNSLVEPLHEIMRIWQKIEKHEYKYEFHGLEGDEQFEVHPNHFVRPFRTVHRVDSLGYTVFRKFKKLDPKYSHLHPTQIADLRRQGVDPNIESEEPLVSFTGDTQIEFLAKSEWPKKSKVLILEATYLDDTKSVEHARTWGHTHIDEIIPHLASIESEKIMIIHTSSRYSTNEAVQLLDKKIPTPFKERVTLFPGR